MKGKGMMAKWLGRVFGEADGAHGLRRADRTGGGRDGGGTAERGGGLGGAHRTGGQGWTTEGGGARMALEPPVTEDDIRSFFAKLDAEERNVPAALAAEWRQLAAEAMERAKDAQEFAYQQGRLAAYVEVEKLFAEVARTFRGRQMAEEAE